jgi:hypothetical protein
MPSGAVPIGKRHMGLSSFPRGVAQLLAVAAVLVWLLCDLIFDVRMDDWPTWARVAAGVAVVGCLTVLALRLTRGTRPDGW